MVIVSPEGGRPSPIIGEHMPKLIITFVRKAEVVEDGEFLIEVSDVNDEEEIQKAIDEKSFDQFLLVDRIYDNILWEYTAREELTEVKKKKK